MRNGLRALGLSFVAALSLMAFAATGAQAQLPGESKVGFFTVNGLKALTTGTTATGVQEGVGTLLVAGRNLDIKCETADVEEGKLLSETEGLAKVLYLNCRAYEHNTPNEIKSCHITSDGVTGDLRIKALAILKPILHGGVAYVLASPDGATSFTIVRFMAGKGCVLPLTNEVKGSVTAQPTALEGNPLLINFSQGIQELTGDKLLFGVFPAFVNASATVSATGKHAGLNLGVH